MTSRKDFVTVVSGVGSWNELIRSVEMNKRIGLLIVCYLNNAAFRDKVFDSFKLFSPMDLF